tara:strand:+ start:1318 stop:1932 length:615 start_codon:yes stop_codon:yes gene_type:complete
MDYNVITLFPKTLAISPNPILEISKEDLDYINSLEFTNNEGNQVSSSITVLEDDYFESWHGKITSQIEYFTRDILKIPSTVGWRVTTSWVNRTRVGGYHHWHNHPNSFISGIIALTDNNRVEFASSWPIFPGWMPDYDEINIHNAENMSMTMQTAGTMCLFPSSTMHSVPRFVPAKEDDVRLSLSFNLIADGPFCTRGVNSLNI